MDRAKVIEYCKEGREEVKNAMNMAHFFGDGRHCVKYLCNSLNCLFSALIEIYGEEPNAGKTIQNT